MGLAGILRLVETAPLKGRKPPGEGGFHTGGGVWVGLGDPVG